MDNETRPKFVSMALNARTPEQIEEVLDSEEYKTASALELALVSSIFGFALLRTELGHVKSELAALRKAVKALGEEE